MKICNGLDEEIATLKVTLKEKKQKLEELKELAEQQKKKKQTGDDSYLEVADASHEAKPVVLEGELEIAMEQKTDVDNKQTPCVCEGIVELQQSIEGTSLADEVIVPGYEKDNDQVVD